MNFSVRMVPVILYIINTTTNAMVLNGTSKETDSKSAAANSLVDVEHEEKLKETKGEKRLSIVDWAGYDNRDLEGPGTYAFGYDIEDASSNNVQFRSEERHPNGSVSGSYGYLEPDGNVRIVHYNADELGFRAHEENSRRGMLKPIIIEGIPEATKIAGYSDKMLAALQSQKVHKMHKSTEENDDEKEVKVQKVHEERTRPKDQYMISSVNTVPVTVAGYTLPPQKVHDTGYPEKILTGMSSNNVYIRQKLEENKKVQKTHQEFTTPIDQYVLNAVPVTYVLNPLRQNAQINYRGTDYFYYIPYPSHY